LIAEGIVLNFQQRCTVASNKLALEARFFNLVNGELAEEDKSLGGT
jgi:hypothetical protein